MKSGTRIVAEVTRGVAFAGMFFSGLLLLLLPGFPIQDADRGEANKVRLTAGVIVGTVFIVCAVVRRQCMRKIAQEKVNEQTKESSTNAGRAR